MLPARLGILLAGLALLGGPPTPASAGSDAAEALTLPVVFPEHPIESKTKDAYLCTAVRLPDRPLKLVGVEPTSDMHVVHHMLLFGEPGSGDAPMACCSCRRQVRTATAGATGATAERRRNFCSHARHRGSLPAAQISLTPHPHPPPAASIAAPPPPLPNRLPAASAGGGGVALQDGACVRHLL